MGSVLLTYSWLKYINIPSLAVCVIIRMQTSNTDVLNSEGLSPVNVVGI
jgi:hypothetical protein